MFGEIGSVKNRLKQWFKNIKKKKKPQKVKYRFISKLIIPFIIIANFLAAFVPSKRNIDNIRKDIIKAKDIASLDKYQKEVEKISIKQQNKLQNSKNQNTTLKVKKTLELIKEKKM